VLGFLCTFVHDQGMLEGTDLGHGGMTSIEKACTLRAMGVHAACRGKEGHTMPRYRITISSRRAEAMVDLVRRHRILVSDHGARRNEEVGFLVHATATDEEIQLLTAEGYIVETRSAVDGPG